jgi:hypothetical protein
MQIKKPFTFKTMYVADIFCEPEGTEFEPIS